MSDQAVPAGSYQSGGGGRWAIAMVVLTAFCLVAPILAVRFAMRSAKDSMKDAAVSSVATLRTLAEVFRQGSVETSLRSYASELQGVSRLQFAELKQDEIFERKDTTSVAWGTIPLPDVVVQASARVVYVYAVDLQKRWEIRLQDRTVDVIAPAPEWSAPALDPSSLKFEVKQGSVLRDEAAVQEALRAGLRDLLNERARAHLPLVRETGRKELARFVREWLLARYSDGSQYNVSVRFADEPALGASPKIPQ